MLWWLGGWLRAQKLSLREKYREGLYDAEHKPRLNFARCYFLEFALDKDIDFGELEKFYRDWRDFDEYIVFQKQTDNLQRKGEVKKETVTINSARARNSLFPAINVDTQFLQEV